jgi:AraC-like DNA-binding protein
MLDSDAPLTRIALEVGFTSLQHFSSQFRDSTGEAPSQWRTRRRA